MFVLNPINVGSEKTSHSLFSNVHPLIYYEATYKTWWNEAPEVWVKVPVLFMVTQITEPTVSNHRKQLRAVRQAYIMYNASILSATTRIVGALITSGAGATRERGHCSQWSLPGGCASVSSCRDTVTLGVRGPSRLGLSPLAEIKLLLCWQKLIKCLLSPYLVHNGDLIKTIYVGQTPQHYKIS